MSGPSRDPTLDTLLDLDDQLLVIDAAGSHWVRFDVKRVPPTPERPHGLRYALTPARAGRAATCLLDNSHAVRSTSGPSGKRRRQHDHKHRHGAVRPYVYEDAATLLTDFWAEVDAVLKERGVKL